MSEIVTNIPIKDARLIKMDDFEDTVEWCGGDPGVMYEGQGEGQHYIQLDHDRGTVGMWIVQAADDNYYILTDAMYKKTFYAASKNREKYSAVLEVVKAAVGDSVTNLSRGGNDLALIAEAAALRIMELTEY